MNKEEILEMAQKDNKNLDIAYLEAQKNGAYVGYYVLVCVLAIVIVINRLVLGFFSYGLLFASFSMFFSAFLVKYIKLRKKHELACVIMWGYAVTMSLVFWILQLCKVW